MARYFAEETKKNMDDAWTVTHALKFRSPHRTLGGLKLLWHSGSQGSQECKVYHLMVHLTAMEELRG